MRPQETRRRATCVVLNGEDLGPCTMPANGNPRGALKTGLRHARRQLADKLSVRIRNLHRYPCCGKGSGAQSLSGGRRLNGRFWQIVLQKSPKALRLIFRQTTKQATIAD